jgi:hypothetical protein
MFYEDILPLILIAFEHHTEAHMHHILIQWAHESSVHENRDLRSNASGTGRG